MLDPKYYRFESDEEYAERTKGGLMQMRQEYSKKQEEEFVDAIKKGLSTAKFTPPNPSHAGAIGGNMGYLGSTLQSLSARLIIERPNAEMPTYGLTVLGERKNEKFGYPCNEISGEKHLTSGVYDDTESKFYTECSNVKFRSYQDKSQPYAFPSAEVLRMIEFKMKGGVYI